MSTTLTNGLKLPDKGSVDWYADMQNNYTILDGAVGTVAEHTSALAGKAPLSHTHTKSDVTDLLNSNFIPSANNAYDLGSSSNQWNNLYSKNYYYNGTAWGLDKANTWSANNKFTDNVSIEKNSPSPTTISDSSLALNGNSNYVYFRTKGSSNFKTYNSWLWAGYLGPGYAGEERMGHLKIYRASDTYGATGEETPDTSFSFIDVALHFKKVNITDNVSFKNDGTINACYPAYNNATDLGTSTNKWKSLNGINPGALSLPDMGTTADVNYFDFISTITHLDGTDNYYTPTVDGWMTVIIAGTALSLFEDATSATNHNQGSGISAAPVKGYCEATIPVHKNVRVKINAIGTSVYMAQVRPCLGNV